MNDKDMGVMTDPTEEDESFTDNGSAIWIVIAFGFVLLALLAAAAIALGVFG